MRAAFEEAKGVYCPVEGEPKLVCGFKKVRGVNFSTQIYPFVNACSFSEL